MGAQRTVNNLISRVDRSPKSGEVLWRIRSDEGTFDLVYGDPDRQFFIASATKLFVTAILCQLVSEGRLTFDTRVAELLPDLDLHGLSVRGGKDHPMTVREVMAHTAGLADYFEGKAPDGTTAFSRAVRADVPWNLADVIEWTREMKPGVPGKGQYSDTGYQLLGAVIERIDGYSFADSVRTRVTEPLGLSRTYCFTEHTLDRYDAVAVMRFGSAPLHIPHAMASVQADGGIVSTLNDSMTFLDAFFDGRLFPQKLLTEVEADWHRIFRPLEYGTGIMRFRLSPLLTGFKRLPPFVGHSGASGTVMFRANELGITIVGTVNQLEHRSLPYQLMVRTSLAATRR